MITHSYTPIALTWFRLLSAPLLVAVFFLTPPNWQEIVTTLTFLLAMTTDFLDGFLARRYNTSTRFGAFLDPVADKIVVTTALLLLLKDDQAPIIAALIIVCREICVSALREWMATVGERQQVNVSHLGKWKTGFQTIAITLLLYHDEWHGIPIHTIGLVLLWVTVILTLWSMVLYLQAAYHSFRSN